MIIFTVFRVISVYFPHKNNVYCTRKQAFIALTVTFIITCLMNIEYLHIQYFSIYDEHSNSIEYDCWFLGKWAHYGQYYADYIVLCFRSIVPFLMLLIGNSLIIYKIHKLNAKRWEMTTNQSPDDSQSMMAMLISISVLFLVTQTPYIITNLIEKCIEFDHYSLV